MSNYLIKIGNLYYAGTHDFTTEQGYLDRQHPRVLIKLNKFDFNATQFASEKYAREVADKVWFRLILNTLKTMINLGHRELQMYMNYRRDLEYKVKG